MKKYISFMTILVLLCICLALSVSAEISTDADGNHAQAAYATVAPVIDGEIDAIWDTTEALWSNGNLIVNDQATGYTKILWDEGHLYLMAVVYENGVFLGAPQTRANGANFWVAEDSSLVKHFYLGEGRYDNYSPDPGVWHIYMNQWDVFWSATAAVEETATCHSEIYEITDKNGNNQKYYYVVECAVPVQTSGLSYSVGHTIGFDLSIDDDVNGDDKRDYYAYWAGLGKYWERTDALARVLLVNAPVVNAPDITPLAPTAPQDNNSNSPKEPAPDYTLWIVCATVVAVVIAAAVIFLLKRKKKQAT